MTLLEVFLIMPNYCDQYFRTFKNMHIGWNVNGDFIFFFLDRFYLKPICSILFESHKCKSEVLSSEPQEVRETFSHK